MKNSVKLMIIIFLLANYSCSLKNKQENKSSLENTAEELIHKIPAGELKVLEIEGCEYIVYQDARHSNLGFGYMTHKGNCKSNIHIYKDITSMDSTIIN